MVNIPSIRSPKCLLHGLRSTLGRTEGSKDTEGGAVGLTGHWLGRSLRAAAAAAAAAAQGNLGNCYFLGALPVRARARARTARPGL